MLPGRLRLVGVPDDVAFDWSATTCSQKRAASTDTRYDSISSVFVALRDPSPVSIKVLGSFGSSNVAAGGRLTWALARSFSIVQYRIQEHPFNLFLVRLIGAPL